MLGYSSDIILYFPIEKWLSFVYLSCFTNIDIFFGWILI